MDKTMRLGMGLGYALTRIPWKSILPYVPTVVETAKELLRNLGKAKTSQEQLSDAAPAPLELAQRVSQLENNEARQAQLVEKMAEQQQKLIESLRILESRVQLLFWFALLLLVVVVALVVYHFVTASQP
jgi:hypothetical protein